MSSMDLFKVEQIIFMRLDQGFIPGVKHYNEAICGLAGPGCSRHEARRSQYIKGVRSAQEVAASMLIVRPGKRCAAVRIAFAGLHLSRKFKRLGKS